MHPLIVLYKLQQIFLVTDSYILLCSPGVVAEVTQPSLGVGYELGRAVAMNTPILCLFRPNEGKGME